MGWIEVEDENPKASGFYRVHLYDETNSPVVSDAYYEVLNDTWSKDVIKWNKEDDYNRPPPKKSYDMKIKVVSRKKGIATSYDD